MCTCFFKPCGTRARGKLLTWLFSRQCKGRWQRRCCGGSHQWAAQSHTTHSVPFLYKRGRRTFDENRKKKTSQVEIRTERSLPNFHYKQERLSSREINATYCLLLSDWSTESFFPPFILFYLLPEQCRRMGAVVSP